MAVEAKRGCGYRKQGGLYLVSDPGGMPCDRLPIALTVCPVCSHGFKQARGFSWVDVAGLVGGVHKDCLDEFPCPLCMATESMGRAGLLWIGEKFYKTPEDFGQEAAALGVSRRIKALPRGFVVGETWILLAHPKTISTPCAECQADGWKLGSPETPCEACAGKGTVLSPAIFKVWRPSRIEKILAESKRGSEEAKELEAKGISIVYVPDNDRDHMGSAYDKDEEDATLPEAEPGGTEAAA